MKKMKLKKLVYLLLICTALLGCVCMDTGAAGVGSGTVTGEAELGPRVTGSFSARVPANSASGSDIGFSLEAGETFDHLAEDSGQSEHLPVHQENGGWQ